MRVNVYSPQHIFIAIMIDVDAFLQALAEPTRLRVLVLLNRETDLCVCELTAALAVSQPKMSRHLAALRGFGIVEDARLANRVFYRLHPELPDWACGAIDRLAEGLAATPAFADVRHRLQVFPNRPRQRALFGCGEGADVREETADAV